MNLHKEQQVIENLCLQVIRLRESMKRSHFRETLGWWEHEVCDQTLIDNVKTQAIHL